MLKSKKTRKFSRIGLLAAVGAALFCWALVLDLPAAAAHESRDVAGGKYQFRVGFLNEPVYQGLDNAVYLAICTGSCTSNPDGTFSNGVTGAFDTIKVEISSNGQTMQLGFKAVPRMPGRYNAEFIPTRVGDYTFRVFGTLGSDNINETFRSGPNTFDSVEPVTAIQFPDKPGFGSGGSGNSTSANPTAPAGAATTAAAAAAATSGNASSSTPASPATVAPNAGTTNASANATNSGSSGTNNGSSGADIQSLTQKLTDQQRQLDAAKSDASTATMVGFGGIIIGLIGVVLAGLALLFARSKNRTSPRPRREVEGG